MKTKRQEKITELIRDNIINTQDELQSALVRLGFKATQSTVSRDIRELRLVKAHDEKGNYRYVSTDLPAGEGAQTDGHFRELFSKAVRKIDYSLNNVVVTCYTGMAQSACVSIDTLFGGMMLGSLAGDDTVFIVTRGEKESAELVGELKKLL